MAYKNNPLVGAYFGIERKGDNWYAFHVVDCVSPGYFIIENMEFTATGEKVIQKSLWSAHDISETGNLYSAKELVEMVGR
jgi:hypothetical protein